MNKLIIIFISLVLSQTLLAQYSSTSSDLSQEIGVRFTGFDDFNLIYKKQRSDSRFLRHRVAVLNGNLRKNAGERTIDLAYAFGIESRKAIRNGVSFYTGPDILINTRYQSTKNQTTDERLNRLNLIPAFGWILGFMVEPVDRMIISIELIPSTTLVYSTTNYTEDDYTFSFGLNTNLTALSLVYRF